MDKDTSENFKRHWKIIHEIPQNGTIKIRTIQTKQKKTTAEFFNEEFDPDHENDIRKNKGKARLLSYPYWYQVRVIGENIHHLKGNLILYCEKTKSEAPITNNNSSIEYNKDEDKNQKTVVYEMEEGGEKITQEEIMFPPFQISKGCTSYNMNSDFRLRVALYEPKTKTTQIQKINDIVEEENRGEKIFEAESASFKIIAKKPVRRKSKPQKAKETQKSKEANSEEQQKAVQMRTTEKKKESYRPYLAQPPGYGIQPQAQGYQNMPVPYQAYYGHMPIVAAHDPMKSTPNQQYGTPFTTDATNTPTTYNIYTPTGTTGMRLQDMTSTPNLGLFPTPKMTDTPPQRHTTPTATQLIQSHNQRPNVINTRPSKMLRTFPGQQSFEKSITSIANIPKFTRNNNWTDTMDENTVALNSDRTPQLENTPSENKT